MSTDQQVVTVASQLEALFCEDERCVNESYSWFFHAMRSAASRQLTQEEIMEACDEYIGWLLEHHAQVESLSRDGRLGTLITSMQRWFWRREAKLDGRTAWRQHLYKKVGRELKQSAEFVVAPHNRWRLVGHDGARDPDAPLPTLPSALRSYDERQLPPIVERGALRTHLQITLERRGPRSQSELCNDCWDSLTPRPALMDRAAYDTHPISKHTDTMLSHERLLELDQLALQLVSSLDLDELKVATLRFSRDYTIRAAAEELDKTKHFVERRWDILSTRAWEYTGEVGGYDISQRTFTRLCIKHLEDRYERGD